MDRVLRGSIVPLLIGAELSLAPHVYVRRQSLEVLEETVLLDGWIEFDESDIGLKQLVGILDTEEWLGEEAKSAGYSVGASAGESCPDTLP